MSMAAMFLDVRAKRPSVGRKILLLVEFCTPGLLK
jgi:hypothetical protein